MQTKIVLIGILLLTVATTNPTPKVVCVQADSARMVELEQQQALLSDRYEDVLLAYERLEHELDRNLALIAIVVGILGVMFPLIIAFLSSRDNTKKIEESENKQRQTVKQVESLALKTAKNFEEYKIQNKVRDLLDGADEEDDSGRAIALYSNVLELQPNNKTALMRRAKRYRQIENYPQAIADYKRVIELAPQYIVAYSLLGLTYYLGKDYDDAIKQYKLALAIDPSYATVHARLANVYNAMEDYPSALVHIRRAIELTPNSVAYHKRLVRILKAQNIVGNDSEIKKEEGIIKELEAEDQR